MKTGAERPKGEKENMRKLKAERVVLLAALMVAIIIGLTGVYGYVKGAQENVRVSANVGLKYSFPFYKDRTEEVLDEVRVNGAENFKCSEEETFEICEGINEILARYGNVKDMSITTNDYSYAWGKMTINNKPLVEAIEKAVATGDGYMVVYNQAVVEASKQVKTQQDVFEYIKKHYTLSDGASSLLTVVRKHSGNGKYLGILAKDICKEADISSFKSNDFGVYTSNGFITFEDLLS